MKLWSVARRTVASAAVIVAATGFVWIFGPRPATVHADIYAPLASAAGFLLPPPSGGSPVRTGKVSVNGAVFNYVMGRSQLPMDTVLSHYERQFESVDPAGKKVSSAARVQGDGAGVVAGLKFGALSHPSDVADRFKAFGATGRLHDLGEFHVVSAFAQHGTVFIDFTPSQVVTVKSLLPEGSTDAAGEDLQGVTRPAGLQRLFTIDHGNEGDWSRTLIYKAADSRTAIDGFRRAFTAAGWSANTLIDSPEVAHYTDGSREAFLGAAGLGTGSTVVIVHRKLANAQQGS